MITRSLHWLDKNILTVLAGFLLVFIPLYPKWPLFDILYGYNVRVRLEDFFVALAVFVYITQLARGKIKLQRDWVTLGIGIYVLFGFLSVLTSIFVIQTVPLEYLHIAKTGLHWLRRIEYYSLFFIVFAAVKSLRTAKVFLGLFFLTLTGVIVYGFGQKYLYWPAFSTMNREFAKGWWLYLTEHARVLSTFGGHYDLAAYLVIALTLAWSFFFGTNKKLLKILYGLFLAGGFWLLILTASRSSFIAYLAGLTVVVFLWTFRKGFGWGVSRWVIATFLSILIMLSFGDLSDRFLHVLRISDRVNAIREIVLKPAGVRPQNNAVFLENNLAAVTSKSDQPPTPLRPADVNGNEIPMLMATISATGQRVLVPKERSYSQNALMYDLSTGIRLDSTWPRAIAGFKVDPLLGSGYATLTKTSKYEFTEGESTDNDYLRALGETGFLGAATFFGVILLMVVLAFRTLGGIREQYLYSTTVGFIALAVGLLANAVMVDIFEASKVAYVFWGVAGLTMASLYLARDQIKANMRPLRIDIPWREYFQRANQFLHRDVVWVMILVVISFALRMYKLDAPVADWHSWRQADTGAVTRNFIANHQINWLYPTYYDLSSVASGKPNPAGLRFVEFPLYNAICAYANYLMPELNADESSRIVTSLFWSLSLVFIFLLVRKTVSQRAAYLAALVFAVLPYGIFYGRSILPDPTMVVLSLGGVWFMSEYLDVGRKRWLILGVILSTAAFLVKPFAAFLLLPIGYFALINIKEKPKRVTVVLGGMILSVIPLLWWRWWIGHYPEGIPANDWLLNGDGIRFKGAFWYWLFADRIGRLILGYWGLILLGIGILRKNVGKYGYFPLVLLLSSFLYLAVFATGNVRHDYYQILLIPGLAIMAGVGLELLLFPPENKFLNRYTTRFLGIIAFLFMLAFGWYFVKDLYNINHPEIVEAGRKVESLSDWKAKVVAPYDGDTAFLYQTHRRGWPIVEKSMDYLIKNGAQYYVSVKFDDLTKKLMTDAWPVWVKRPENLKKVYPYKILALTDKYVIIQLVPDSQLPK